MPELKPLPCPACGNEEHIVVVESIASGRFRAFCLCGHTGPFCDTKEQAISAYNALPRALRWTTEPPKVAGGYLARQRKHESEDGWTYPVFINVEFSVGYFRKLEWVQYAGPIPAPVEE